MELTAAFTQRSGPRANGEASPQALQAGAERAAELESKRRALGERSVDRVAAARAKSAEQLAELREAIERVTGADTRLSISRSSISPNFVYQAIDRQTGEVVQEWPPDRFAALIRGVRDDVRADLSAGVLIDDVA